MSEISEDQVVERLAELGISVEYVSLPQGVWGFYSHQLRRVALQASMPAMYRLPTLLHECGHVAREDTGHQSERVERAIDEQVAAALISPADFRLAEMKCDYHTGGIAHELELPKWVVRAYRRVLAKQLAKGVPLSGVDWDGC